jgi:MYXO-CTERM domain-containing protein
VDMDDGCNCTTGHRHAWGGAAWSLLGLGLLGLGRRRRGR